MGMVRLFGRVKKMRSRGFTLVEVMISLTIFAVVSAALVRNASMTVHQTVLVQERTLASWVAENQLNEMRYLPRDDDNFPSIGTDHLSVKMARREWELVVEVSQTENPDMRRVEVFVYKGSDSEVPLAHISGFMGKH